MFKFKSALSWIMACAVSLFVSHKSTAQEQHIVMANVAGNGTTSVDLSGTPTTTGFQAPGALVVDANDDIFFSSSANDAIYKVDVSENKLEVLFNTTTFGDGGTITGLALDESLGRFYFGKSSFWDHRILSIDYSGAMTPICGEEHMAGPGGLEDLITSTLCGAVTGMTLAPNGDLYFIDINYNLIRRIDFAEGKVYRVAGVPITAGTDDETFNSILDGTNALSDTIKPKGGLAINDEGEVFYSTTDHTIRKIAVDGTVTTIAGIANNPGFDGELMDADDSRLFAPAGLYLFNNGTLLICDEANDRMRFINEAGKLVTVAGNGGTEGSPGSIGYLESGQFLPPQEVTCRPFGVFVHTDGVVYMSDTGSKRIRKMFLCTNPEIMTATVSQNVICLGDEINLEITGDLNDATQWNWYQGSCDIGGETISNAKEISVTANTNESYYIIGIGGCTNEVVCQEIKVEISCKTHFNTFTPNGDGKNDFFEIPGLNNFPINKVSFYNRWGDLLETVENYDNEANVWEGTNGSDDDDDNGVDSGTYYFTAEVDGEILISGWVEIILTK